MTGNLFNIFKASNLAIFSNDGLKEISEFAIENSLPNLLSFSLKSYESIGLKQGALHNIFLKKVIMNAELTETYINWIDRSSLKFNKLGAETNFKKTDSFNKSKEELDQLSRNINGLVIEDADLDIVKYDSEIILLTEYLDERKASLEQIIRNSSYLHNKKKFASYDALYSEPEKLFEKLKADKLEIESQLQLKDFKLKKESFAKCIANIKSSNFDTILAKSFKEKLAEELTEETIKYSNIIYSIFELIEKNLINTKTRNELLSIIKNRTRLLAALDKEYFNDKFSTTVKAERQILELLRNSIKSVLNSVEISNNIENKKYNVEALPEDIEATCLLVDTPVSMQGQEIDDQILSQVEIQKQAGIKSREFTKLVVFFASEALELYINYKKLNDKGRQSFQSDFRVKRMNEVESLEKKIIIIIEHFQLRFTNDLYDKDIIINEFLQKAFNKSFQYSNKLECNKELGLTVTDEQLKCYENSRDLVAILANKKHSQLSKIQIGDEIIEEQTYFLSFILTGKNPKEISKEAKFFYGFKYNSLNKVFSKLVKNYLPDEYGFDVEESKIFEEINKNNILIKDIYAKLVLDELVLQNVNKYLRDEQCFSLYEKFIIFCYRSYIPEIKEFKRQIEGFTHFLERHKPEIQDPTSLIFDSIEFNKFKKQYNYFLKSEVEELIISRYTEFLNKKIKILQITDEDEKIEAEGILSASLDRGNTLGRVPELITIKEAQSGTIKANEETKKERDAKIHAQEEAQKAQEREQKAQEEAQKAQESEQKAQERVKFLEAQLAAALQSQSQPQTSRQAQSNDFNYTNMTPININAQLGDNAEKKESWVVRKAKEVKADILNGGKSGGK